MKAVILAAGYATRMYLLTKNQFKPLLKVGNKPIQPKSALASIISYIFHKNDLLLVEKVIEQYKVDNPGDLVKFLVKKSEVHEFVFNEHWFDAGSFESLKAAEELYFGKEKLN